MVRYFSDQHVGRWRDFPELGVEPARAQRRPDAVARVGEIAPAPDFGRGFGARGRRDTGDFALGWIGGCAPRGDLAGLVYECGLAARGRRLAVDGCELDALRAARGHWSARPLPAAGGKTLGAGGEYYRGVAGGDLLPPRRRPSGRGGGGADSPRVPSDRFFHRGGIRGAFCRDRIGAGPFVPFAGFICRECGGGFTREPPRAAQAAVLGPGRTLGCFGDSAGRHGLSRATPRSRAEAGAFHPFGGC